MTFTLMGHQLLYTSRVGILECQDGCCRLPSFGYIIDVGQNMRDVLDLRQGAVRLHLHKVGCQTKASSTRRGERWKVGHKKHPIYLLMGLLLSTLTIVTLILSHQFP